ncbi:MAG: hypothetical protein NC834_03390, partial [Candidatus Omnitrophica bacterium]|nr:hypothetical protein [Candidatus Omnitrophota bacterium]
MKRRTFLFLFLIPFTTLTFGEDNWQQNLFTQSPRIEYLNKELQKRYSIYKLIENQLGKISNPLLLREGLIYLLHSIEIEKEKFLILKEIKEIFSRLEKIEKEIELFINIDNLFPFSSEEEISPQAKIWWEKEKIWLKKELERKIREKSFYLNLLRKNFNLDHKIEPDKILSGISVGFEKEIIKKSKELLEWEKYYFFKNKERYPHLPHYLILSTSLPYVFFSLPLHNSQAEEIFNLLSEQKEIKLQILEWENSFAEEKIYLQLYYLQQKREVIREILTKIEKAKKLPLSFEEISTLKDIFLKTSLSLLELDDEESLLKEETLRYSEYSPERVSAPNLSLGSFSA